MSIRYDAPWHKESFGRFVNERLPELLAGRLPLADYRVESTGPYTCLVKVVLSSAAGDVEVQYPELPQPDGEGVFEIDGEPRVVLPIASREQLDVAEVTCVGEQLYELVQSRLGTAAPNLPWSEQLARTWLPLDRWLDEFFRQPSTARHTLYFDPVPKRVRAFLPCGERETMGYPDRAELATCPRCYVAVVPDLHRETRATGNALQLLLPRRTPCRASRSRDPGTFFIRSPHSPRARCSSPT